MSDLSTGGFQVVPVVMSPPEVSHVATTIKDYTDQRRPRVAEETISVAYYACSHRVTDVPLPRFATTVGQRVDRAILPTFSYWRLDRRGQCPRPDGNTGSSAARTVRGFFS